MMDVSDGLAKDLHALTPGNAVPALDPTAIPRRAACDLRQALTDGEDYELVFVEHAPADLPALEHRWRRKFPTTRLTRIGRFVAPKQVPATAINLQEFAGYEHLKR